jgi:hypothetical protein
VTNLLPFRPPECSDKPLGHASAPVVNISRPDCFDLKEVRKQAAVYAALPNLRDVQAAVSFFLRDYGRCVRLLHDIAGEELKGAEIAVEATMRKEINRIRKERRWPLA